MSRQYEVIELRDLIDETFGPMEFQVDRILYHEPQQAAESVLQETSAEVRIWDRDVQQDSGGRDYNWVPYAWEDGDDEPDECKRKRR